MTGGAVIGETDPVAVSADPSWLRGVILEEGLVSG
jgi:hypothetical protein